MPTIGAILGQAKMTPIIDLNNKTIDAKAASAKMASFPKERWRRKRKIHSPMHFHIGSAKIGQLGDRSIKGSNIS